MGLSAFNAMRARMKAEAKALGKADAAVSKPIVEPSIVAAAEEKPAASIEPKADEKPAKVDESDSKKEEPKKTDAEKLKKKKD